MRQLRVPYREWRRLCRRAYAAQQKEHSEVCGLFAADKRQRVFLIFITNESTKPGHFEFGWKEFRRARHAIRAAGCRFPGTFHSHPISEAVIGPGDLRHAGVNSLHLIYDVCGTDVRLWRVARSSGRKKPVELPLIIQRSKPLS